MRILNRVCDHWSITLHSKRYIKSSHYIFTPFFRSNRRIDIELIHKLHLARQPIPFHVAPAIMALVIPLLCGTQLAPLRGRSP